jgi:hypothetical protein
MDHQTRCLCQQGCKRQGKTTLDRKPTSKFVGVSRKANGEWQADCHHEKTKRSASLLTETAAARRYDTWATQLFGAKARLNRHQFPYIGQE